MSRINGGPAWVKHFHPDVSEFGIKVASLLDDLFRGIHHVSKPIRHPRVKWDRSDWIEIVFPKTFATFDNCDLTDLVILAHKYQIRVEIRAKAYRYIEIVFHNSGVWGGLRTHPDLSDLISEVEKHMD